jgi:hypothetical protein
VSQSIESNRIEWIKPYRAVAIVAIVAVVGVGVGGAMLLINPTSYCLPFSSSAPLLPMGPSAAGAPNGSSHTELERAPHHPRRSTVD